MSGRWDPTVHWIVGTGVTLARTVILVVEDDRAIRQGLCDALEFKGYSVLGCDNGDRGLELALSGSPDLVLLDVLLPGMEGFTVLRELRKARPRLPVIMLTARGTEEDRVRGLEQGADDEKRDRVPRAHAEQQSLEQPGQT